ncbi:hypothetical protein FACS1894184_15020 [Clostridia bacterium]|nr:hypothetical protein FACS1894184_15020 [Clostridia bacterium]
MAKKKRPMIQLRAAPDNDSEIIYAVEQPVSVTLMAQRDEWQFVHVKAKDRIVMGWMRIHNEKT